MHACPYVCMHARMCACMHENKYIYIYSTLGVHSTSVRMHACPYVCMHARACVGTCACIHARVHARFQRCENISITHKHMHEKDCNQVPLCYFHL